MNRRPLVLLLAVPLLHCAAAPEPGPAPPPLPTEAPPVAVTAAAPPGAAGDAPPATPRKPVVDDYAGTKVTDDYQWLEAAADPDVRAWSEAQNRFTRARLDAYPARKPLHDRVSELARSASADHFGLRLAGKRLFAWKTEPPKQQAFLTVLRSPDDLGGERAVVDPNAIDPTGGTAIDFAEPSPDGKLVAVSLSKGGSESGDLHLYEVDTGKELPDVIPHVNGGTAGGSVAWTAGGKGFFYTRYPHAGERPAIDLDFYQQVYFHQLGTSPSADTYAIGKDFPRIAEVALLASPDGRYTLAEVANGDGGEFGYFLRGPKGTWTEVTRFSDQCISARFGVDGKLYLVSRQGAPHGKLLRLSPEAPSLAKAALVVPEGDGVIQRVVVTKTRIFVDELVGGPHRVRILDLAGKPRGEVELPGVASVNQLARLEGDDVLVRVQTYVEPPRYVRYDAKAGKAVPTALRMTGSPDFSDTEVVRETCTSKDGTKVPLNVVRRKGTVLDGSNPTLLYGYGGYSVSLSPRFEPLRRTWLDQGGVFAVANLRGGGELGEAWHAAGALTHKQNVFDDFAACAQHLFDTKVTSPAHLAIEGGSNGGLLMGAALVQHPDFYRAVVSHVGIYDMLRVELTPNGAFNVTEFGTVKDPQQREALLAYSPYHHVGDGVPYPSVLFLTGANDPRVDPYNSRKMTARLQAATASGRPILLRTSGATGHGMGTPLDAVIEETADVYGFLFQELGVPYRPVAMGSQAAPNAAGSARP